VPIITAINIANVLIVIVENMTSQPRLHFLSGRVEHHDACRSLTDLRSYPPWVAQVSEKLAQSTTRS
jgi:hypothetical protein